MVSLNNSKGGVSEIIWTARYNRDSSDSLYSVDYRFRFEFQIVLLDMLKFHFPTWNFIDFQKVSFELKYFCNSQLMFNSPF